ncbi:Hypothetical protein KVN_LOCUS399 [uncultured virus]|nr:Hypothetical protein KVN_LOCUS399 [uncultured virus]
MESQQQKITKQMEQQNQQILDQMKQKIQEQTSENKANPKNPFHNMMEIIIEDDTPQFLFEGIQVLNCSSRKKNVNIGQHHQSNEVDAGISFHKERVIQLKQMEKLKFTSINKYELYMNTKKIVDQIEKENEINNENENQLVPFKSFKYLTDNVIECLKYYSSKLEYFEIMKKEGFKTINMFKSYLETKQDLKNLKKMSEDKEQSNSSKEEVQSNFD